MNHEPKQATGQGTHDEALLADLRAGAPGAQAALFDRFHDYVERLVTRVFGFDSEVPDLVQDVFEAAFVALPRFRGDHGALPSWMGQIAVRTVRSCIRKRQALRLLGLRYAAEAAGMPAATLPAEERQVIERTYRVLDRLPAQERLVFVLRAMEGLEVDEVAALCEISVATVKRRTKNAHERFWKIAARDPVLSEWRREREGA